MDCDICSFVICDIVNHPLTAQINTNETISKTNKSKCVFVHFSYPHTMFIYFEAVKYKALTFSIEIKHQEERFA